MQIHRFLSVSIVALLSAGAAAHAGTFTTSSWTGDADSGISTAINYTATADFNGNGTRVINGVSFASGSPITSSYALVQVPNGFANYTSNITGVSNGAVSDFFYGAATDGTATLTLGNLVVGQTYTTTWYNVGFGDPGKRQINITPGDTNVPFVYDENANGNGNGSLLQYTFVAQRPVMTYSFDAVVDADTFHHYLMTNAGPNSMTSSFITPTYQSQTGVAPFTPTFQPLNDDLLQTKLASAIGTGNFTQEGSGGLPILTNGQFSINNTQLATGANASSVVFNLDLTGAPGGYDISKIIGYGGWNDNGRDHQLFQVSYSVIGDSNFAFLGQADFDPTIPGSTPSAVQSTFETALSGVDAIRIDFPVGQENTYAGYGEFDVVGSATLVPEPGSAALVALGLAAFGLHRRRTADRM